MRKLLAVLFALLATSAAAQEIRKQSSTSYPVPIYLVSSTDHVTAVTGATVTATCSKNGAAFGACSGAVSELSSGIYLLAGNATDRDTIGTLIIRATAAGADDALVKVSIVAFDPAATDLGLSNVSANVTQISGDSTAADNAEAAFDGGAYNVGGGSIVAASVTGAVGSVTGAVGSVTGNVGGNVAGSVASVTGNVGGNVTGSVGSVAAGGITASSIADDAIGSNEVAATAVTEIQSGLALEATLATVAGYIDTEVAAIKAKTDQLTFTLANKVDSSIQAAGDFAQGAADKVWSSATRTLTSFGTLASDTATAVWAAGTRTLTSFGSLVADISAALVDVDATVSSVIADGDDLELVPGDAYDVDHNRQRDVVYTGPSSLVGGTCKLVIDGAGLSVTASTVLNAGTATQTCRFEFTALQTATLTRIGTSAYRWQLQATWAADSPEQPAVLARGNVSTIKRAAP